MKSLTKTIARYRHRKDSALEAIAYFVRRTTRRLGIAPDFFSNLHGLIARRSLKKRWLKTDAAGSFFDFAGAKLPDISADTEKMDGLRLVFPDVFLIPCFYNDNHEKSIVERLDKRLGDGSYGYADGAFDVTIGRDEGEVVIDAGAWIGDFSAYAASKGATVFAFEPIEETFEILKKTAALNGGKIIPVKQGLGSAKNTIEISIDPNNSGANSMIVERKSEKTELVQITTLDDFVRENKLDKVTFIKADIEGAERDMLRGATNVLKEFAPKLAICTYHLPDDKEVLERIILEINPRYKVVHQRRKLFAAVI